MPFGPHLLARRFSLGNGLRVWLLRDAAAPTVSYQTWYRVGSRHETPGKTGLAHLFEHLMFGATTNHPAGEFDRLLESAGAETNAATWTDWTHYYEHLPKRELALAVRLEADRMQHLVLREAEVRSEKEVVANERRYRVDDDVEGAATERLFALALRRHPYRWPTIGWMRDIERFSLEDCERFYRTYYAPNNATVVVAGDFSEAHALELIAAHYGGMEAASIPAEQVVREPRQRRERRETMRFETQTPKLLVGYPAPAYADQAHATATVASLLLCDGRLGRLSRRLEYDLEYASSCDASLTPFRHAGLYDLFIDLREDIALDDVVRVVDEELARLAEAPCARDELERAKNRLELGFLHGMETAGGKAELLGFHDTVTGDARTVFQRLDEYRAVSAEDVQALAADLFGQGKRTRVDVVPASARVRAR